MNRDIFRLKHILECCSRIEIISNNVGTIDQFKQRWIEQDAMIRNFEILGEASNHLSKELKMRHPNIEWHKIRGMRNLISHEYFAVRLETIWETAINVIPNLKIQIQEIITDLKD